MRNVLLRAGIVLGLVVAFCACMPERRDFDRVLGPYGPMLEIPRGVLATAGPNQVVISWESVVGATSYNIYWTTNGTDPAKTSPNVLAGAVSPLVHAGLGGAREYRYVVTAENDTGESPVSAVVSATPFDLPAAAEFVCIQPGEFLMGSIAPVTNEELIADEIPRHLVRITKPFFMAKYETTVADYRVFVDATGHVSYEGFDGTHFLDWLDPFPDCHSQTDDEPVVCVSWDDAKAYCNWLSQQTGMSCRLPTEAQWEYCARGPNNLEYPWGNTWDPARCNAWDNVYGGGCYAGGTNDGYIYTAPVGSFSPSGDGPFGICDMAGNVGEWCEDFYDENYYDVCPRDDPSGPSSGIWHATRGGDWDFGVRRSADRWYQAPMWGDRSLGFRVVFVLRDE